MIDFLPGWIFPARFLLRGNIVFLEKIYKAIVLLGLVSLFAVCSGEDNSGTDGNGNTVKPAAVYFFNESSYRVDIYKNLNPENFDPTTLVCTVNSGQTVQVEQYPSSDQLIGDAFYPRYQILMENQVETGTVPLYAEAQRVLTNLTFVIESGGRYTKTIPNPDPGELSYIDGYIIVQNFNNTQLQIIRGTTILSRMDNGTVYIEPYSKLIYYKIPFSYFDTSITINQLIAFSDHNIPFPNFTMERGKKYFFTVQGDTVTGPVVDNIAVP